MLDRVYKQAAQGSRRLSAGGLVAAELLTHTRSGWSEREGQRGG